MQWTLNAYQQYIDTVLASDVSDETAAAIMENKDVLTGVDISEDSIRKYTDGNVFCIYYRIYRTDFPG